MPTDVQNRFVEMLMGPVCLPIRSRGTSSNSGRLWIVGYSCAKEICREVIHDDVPHTFVEIVESDDDESQVTRVSHYGMGIGTNDNIIEGTACTPVF